MRFCLVVALACLALPAASSAAPLLLQGALRTPAGGPVADGTYILLVGLYDAADAALPKWDETLTQVVVQGGFFHTVLGANPAKPIPAAWLENGLPLWLQVQVGSEPPLPRITLGRVPAAWRANVAGRAEDLACTGCVATDDLADGAVTGAKIAPASIQASHLAFTYAASKSQGGPAESALDADHAGAADQASEANHATQADHTLEADHAKQADLATSADEATTASTASKLVCDQCVSPDQLHPDTKAAFVAAQAGAVSGGLTVSGGLVLGDSLIEGGRFAAIDIAKAPCTPAELGRVAIDVASSRLYFCDGKTYRRLVICSEVCPQPATITCGQPLANGCGDAGDCTGKGSQCPAGQQCIADTCVLMGTSQDFPALTCKAILAADSQAKDGMYWLDPDGDGAAPLHTWCDMTTDGGGWAIVWASVAGDPGERPYTTNAYGSDPSKGKFKLALAQLQSLANTEHILIRKDAPNQWLKVGAGFFTAAIWPKHNHVSATITSASGQTAIATYAVSNVQNAGGGWYALAAGAPDHHSASYLDLNSGCSNDYVYTYAGNFFAVNTALGAGWPGSGCSNVASSTRATWIGVR